MSPRPPAEKLWNGISFVTDRERTVKRTPDRATWIGWFGCDKVDRIVWVGAPRGTTQRSLLKLRHAAWKEECPGCGEVHTFRPSWEKVGEWERRKRNERTLSLEDAIFPPRTERGQRRPMRASTF